MPDQHTPDILPLLAACMQGDRMAQQQLYRRLYEKMLGTAMRYADDRMEAEAILNQACLKIFQSLPNFNGRQAFYPWARSIVLYTAIDHLRKTMAYRQKFQVNEIPANEQHHLNEALNNLHTEDIFRCIQQLPRALRTVFCLYEIDGFQHSEIAQQLGVSESTSRWHLSEAKKRLRELLVPAITESTCPK